MKKNTLIADIVSSCDKTLSSNLKHPKLLKILTYLSNLFHKFPAGYRKRKFPSPWILFCLGGTKSVEVSIVDVCEYPSSV